jgi:hypothetical protein
MKKHLILALAAISNGLSFAASNDSLTGIEVGLGYSMSSHQVRVQNWANTVYGGSSANPNAGELDGTAGNQATPSLVLAYTYQLSAKQLLGLEYGIDLNKTKVLSDPNAAFLSTPASAVVQKSHSSLGLLPGLLIAPTTEIYGKLSYHQTSLYDPNTPVAMDRQNYHGTGFGVGIKTKIESSWILDLNMEQVNYKAKVDCSVNNNCSPIATVKPSSTIATASIRYSFY